MCTNESKLFGQAPARNNPAADVAIHQRKGELAGGWWIVGEAPLPYSVLVCVDTTDEMLDEMAENPNYLFIEDVIDG